MISKVRSIGVLIGFVLTIPGKEILAQDSLPNCSTTLDQLKARVESNYAGYLLEVKGARRIAYDSALVELSARAAGADSDRCLDVLLAYTGWFGDPHLFLFQSAKIDSAQAARRIATNALQPFDTLAFLEELRRPDHGRDPIEGIWTDGRLRVAVIPEGDRQAGRFVAVVITPDTVVWPLYSVRARFQRTGAGRYQAEVSLANHARRRLEASIHRNDLLRTSPGMWGREAPTISRTTGQLDPNDPRRPTLRTIDGTVIVAMPSHDPAYRAVLDSLVASNAEALRGAARLIIDLRGNEGGSSSTSNALAPYVLSDGQTEPPSLDQSAARILSSPDQMAYASYAFGPDTTAYVRGLIARMEAAPGALVPLLDPASPPGPANLPAAIVGPLKVGILVDRGTVSAAEVLVLYARQSSRVRIYGEHTAGALDYQSTSIVALHADESRWYLGYPTITRNDSLPAGRMRGVGIKPDVLMDFAQLSDPIGWVNEDLRRR